MEVVMLHIIKIYSHSKEFRDEALAKARAKPDITILAVGISDAKDEWFFLYIRKESNEPAVQILGYREFPDRPDFDIIASVKTITEQIIQNGLA